MVEDQRSVASSTPQTHLKALDGIRGIAILCVLVFHGAVYFESGDGGEYWVTELFKAGWLGVDLFFVLSGFLITGILLDTRESTRFYGVFYLRRFLRIAPLYFLVLSVIFGILPLVWSFSSPSLSFLNRNQGWFWAYLPNWGFVYHRRAFGNADWLWLDHFWSLAVEEQFYIVWPFIVRRLRESSLIIVCLVLAFGSLFLRISLSIAGLSAGSLYFPTPCRLDGLALGSIVAVIVRTQVDRTRVARFFGGVGLFAVASIAAIFVLRRGFRFSDHLCLTVGIFLFSIASMSLVARVALSRDEGGRGGILKSTILGWVGKYSYGTYVLHHLLLPWMLITFSPTLFAQWTGPGVLSKFATIVAVIACSLAVGYVSWHLWEKWFLSLKRYAPYKQREI